MAKFKRVSTDHTPGKEIDIPEYDALPPAGPERRIIEIMLKALGLEKV